jgi:hypothetical protein
MSATVNLPCISNDVLLTKQQSESATGLPSRFGLDHPQSFGSYERGTDIKLLKVYEIEELKCTTETSSPLELSINIFEYNL